MKSGEGFRIKSGRRTPHQAAGPAAPFEGELWVFELFKSWRLKLETGSEAGQWLAWSVTSSSLLSHLSQLEKNQCPEERPVSGRASPAGPSLSQACCPSSIAMPASVMLFGEGMGAGTLRRNHGCHTPAHICCCLQKRGGWAGIVAPHLRQTPFLSPQFSFPESLPPAPAP